MFNKFNKTKKQKSWKCSESSIDIYIYEKRKNNKYI